MTSMSSLAKSGVARMAGCHSRVGGNPVTKKYKPNKFLKLKAQIISLFSGFPLPRE